MKSIEIDIFFGDKHVHVEISVASGSGTKTALTARGKKFIAFVIK